MTEDRGQRSNTCSWQNIVQCGYKQPPAP